PIEDVFEGGRDHVAVIAAGDFDVFDLDAELLAGLDHFSGLFDGHGRVVVAVDDYPGDARDGFQPGRGERSSAARNRPDGREELGGVDRDRPGSVAAHRLAPQIDAIVVDRKVALHLLDHVNHVAFG